jgi:hypothetical protein
VSPLGVNDWSTTLYAPAVLRSFNAPADPENPARSSAACEGLESVEGLPLTGEKEDRVTEKEKALQESSRPMPDPDASSGEGVLPHRFASLVDRAYSGDGFFGDNEEFWS